MNSCKKCGVYVNLDNPNIHCGGHICQDKDLEQVGEAKKYGLDIQEYKQRLYLNSLYGDPMPNRLK